MWGPEVFDERGMVRQGFEDISSGAADKSE